jgi:hypothetical protein
MHGCVSTPQNSEVGDGLRKQQISGRTFSGGWGKLEKVAGILVCPALGVSSFIQANVSRLDSAPNTRFLFLFPQAQRGTSDLPSARPNGVIEYSTLGGTC